MPNLNVGVGRILEVAYPFVPNCLNADLQRLPGTNVICDAHNLPFKNRAFENVFCFHVLEHLADPARALKELVRVASRLVEIEVPHRYGSMAGNHGHNKNGSEDVGLWHVGSFRALWFHRCLRNHRRCVKVLYEFPFNLLIHVWVFLDCENSQY